MSSLCCCSCRSHPDPGWIPWLGWDPGKQKELSWCWGEVLDPQKGIGVGWGSIIPPVRVHISLTCNSQNLTAAGGEDQNQRLHIFHWNSFPRNAVCSEWERPGGFAGCRTGKVWGGIFLTLPGHEEPSACSGPGQNSPSGTGVGRKGHCWCLGEFPFLGILTFVVSIDAAPRRI